MKQFFTLLLVLALTSIFFAKGIDSKVKELKQGDGQMGVEGIMDTDLFAEGWESGVLGPWQTMDETSVAPMWHLDDWMGYNSTMSWWMADPTFGTNGGYANSWYQVLDTEGIMISGTSPTLTFYQRYSCEDPAGATAPYTGWDGMNCRISTDGGLTWEVLLNPTPAYTSTSLYSFGFEHGEGANVPGWAGTSATWSMVTFDLTAYVGQTVKIRWAFASDPAYATNDGAPALFGWQVDDIVVANAGGTIWSNDGVAAGMTASNWAATGADLWNVTDGNSLGGANTGTWFASCNDGETYAPNMINSLSGVYVNLPSVVTEVYFDFAVRGSWLDNNTFPEVDYFGAYIQVQGEDTRRFISNITQDPNGSNFVYSDAPAVWGLFSATYSTGLVDLSSLIGQSVKPIFEFESDEDTPIGLALQVDDVRIWTPQVVPVEFTTFTAVQKGSKVNLSWNTATELNNQGFEVERKVITTQTASEWKTVGYVEGHGTMTEPVDYNFSDGIAGIKADVIVYRLKQIDYNGVYQYSDEVEVTGFIPTAYELSQNYPNPFNPSTTISFALPADNFVSLRVYNLLGQEVATIFEGFLAAGNYDQTFDASSLTSGLYVYVLRSGSDKSTADFTATNKMMLLK